MWAQPCTSNSLRGSDRVTRAAKGHVLKNLDNKHLTSTLLQMDTMDKTLEFFLIFVIAKLLHYTLREFAYMEYEQFSISKWPFL